ncbi:uncharacterized protein LOC129590694 [Paramacrobiotus metropolitanus]|uniref:uncharacterized protein LOC129590694 n=1 Tax=Paramacrobiotus metropolitanus TaxID=2943436 RepID=UPI00244632F4|nr:uncharacterized protein LOC129590694 [Paramacrobiotus metropolitanus]
MLRTCQELLTGYVDRMGDSLPFPAEFTWMADELARIRVQLRALVPHGARFTLESPTDICYGRYVVYDFDKFIYGQFLYYRRDDGAMRYESEYGCVYKECGAQKELVLVGEHPRFFNPFKWFVEEEVRDTYGPRLYHSTLPEIRLQYIMREVTERRAQVAADAAPYYSGIMETLHFADLLVRWGSAPEVVSELDDDAGYHQTPAKSSANAVTMQPAPVEEMDTDSVDTVAERGKCHPS